MKSLVYMQVDDQTSSDMINKLIELGYADTSRHIWGGLGIQIYCVDMTLEDLTLLKLSIPLIQIDKFIYAS